MFGLGIFELVIIAAVVLVFIRPEDLPRFLHRVGKLYAQLKDFYNIIRYKYLKWEFDLRNSMRADLEKPHNEDKVNNKGEKNDRNDRNDSDWYSDSDPVRSIRYSKDSQIDRTGKKRVRKRSKGGSIRKKRKPAGK